MDLVADMIFQRFQTGQASDIEAAVLRPEMRRRLSRMPVIGKSGLARNGDRLLNRMRDYPRWLAHQASQYDLFHIVDHSYGQLAHELPPERTVITCHDLITFRCLIEPEAEARPRWFRAMTQRILDGMVRCAKVICVSQAVRDEVLRLRLVPSDRLAVVHNGAHPSCSPIANPSWDLPASRLLDSNGAGSPPILLHVGSTVPRKRIDVLLHVFAAVRKQAPEARLVRVGGPFTAAQEKLSQKLGVRSAITVLPFLERDLLSAVYRRASVVLQPSDAEGFGLPVIEAMACGCPVIASDLPVLREVGGDAALYCATGEVAAWSEAVTGLIETRQSDPAAYQQLRQASINHAADFTWASAAERLTQIYRQVLKTTTKE